MFNYKLLTLLLVFFCSCQRNVESFEAKTTNSNNLTENITQPNLVNTENIINTSEQNSNETKVENLCCNPTIKVFISTEIDQSWLSENGEKYNLAQTSKQKLVSKLLIASERQYDLSYKAKSEEISEEISELNVIKTVTTDENGVVLKSTKTYLPSKAEKKLGNAKLNIKKSSISFCKNTKLEFVTEENTVKKVDFQTCEDNVYKILLKVHQGAIKQSEIIMEPLRNKNERKF